MTGAQAADTVGRLQARGRVRGGCSSIPAVRPLWRSQGVTAVDAVTQAPPRGCLILHELVCASAQASRTGPEDRVPEDTRTAALGTFSCPTWEVTISGTSSWNCACSSAQARGRGRTEGAGLAMLVPNQEQSRPCPRPWTPGCWFSLLPPPLPRRITAASFLSPELTARAAPACPAMSRQHHLLLELVTM